MDNQWKEWIAIRVRELCDEFSMKSKRRKAKPKRSLTLVRSLIVNMEKPRRSRNEVRLHD